jgi:hypothetical protein
MGEFHPSSGGRPISALSLRGATDEDRAAPTEAAYSKIICRLLKK